MRPSRSRHSVLLSSFALIAVAATGCWQPMTSAEAIRLLRQSTFGPTPDLIAHVQTVGAEFFLLEQFVAPTTAYPDLPDWPSMRPDSCTGTCMRDNYTIYPLQVHFFKNALYGQDQLRQRVAFALGQILVVSGRDVLNSSWMRPYQQLLYDNAFGNYRDLLYAVTLNPAMGNYLDMVNNRCQRRDPVNLNVCRNGQVAKPNENFAREVLQLFSIGVDLLNADGTPVLDPEGRPIPTYTQETVEEFARVFTGWVFAPALPGPPEVGGTVTNYRHPMVVHVDSLGREDYHDRGEKTLLNGVQIPAGLPAEEDLRTAIANLASHPNTAPVISKQLIQHLVMSNPSPGYVQRVAEVFAGNVDSPSQLQFVVRAVLIDPEARQNLGDGHLFEPALFMTNFLRMFNVASYDRQGPSDGVLNSVSIANFQIGSAQMSQDIFNAPSVFNFYPPDATVPGQGDLLGPEFRLYTSSTALRRANFVSRMVYPVGTAAAGIPAAAPDRPVGTSIDLSPYMDLANDPDALVTRLNELMLHETMSNDVRDIIVGRVSAIPATQLMQRVRDAVYLTAILPSYEVGR
jgi:uncharacterized protein (DUF1800 family)